MSSVLPLGVKTDEAAFTVMDELRTLRNGLTFLLAVLSSHAPPAADVTSRKYTQLLNFKAGK